MCVCVCDIGSFSKSVVSGDPGQNRGFWMPEMEVKDLGNSFNHDYLGLEVFGTVEGDWLIV